MRLESLSALKSLPHDAIIDVRAPAEFAEDHIPGALSLPVLSDAERAEVGTLYKQVDPFTARKVGAALVARNAAAHLEGPLADRPYRWQPLLYCWRGGQRSASFASILAQIGWRAETVEGGYRSYRQLVVRALYETPPPAPMILIGGHTGNAKTRLLALLSQAGAQVLDLEGMAAHRGSLFGGFAGGQPSQKMFESRLAAGFGALDPGRPVFLEAEASRIGDLAVPKAVWQAMRAAPRVEIAAPLAARAEFTLRHYADVTADPEVLRRRIEQLRPYHGAEQIADWHRLAGAGAFRQLAMELMERHYDPRYAKAAAAHRPPAETIRLESLDDAGLAPAVARLLAFGGTG